jgi:DNA-binding response OmpR family regulator
VFELTLPLDGDPGEINLRAIRSKTPMVTEEIIVKGKHVVVVEDDDLVAGGLINLLQSMGAVVLPFHNAEEALRYAKIATADFYIVDYALGGELSGLQLLETLQLKRKTPIRAIVVTGETSSQFIHSVAYSPWPILHKPINHTKLVSFLFGVSRSTPDQPDRTSVQTG